MSVLHFGIYSLCRSIATERDGSPVFEVGEAPELQGYNFGDVDFSSGEQLSFILEDDALVAASNAAFEEPDAFRDRLFSAARITGTVLRSGFFAPLRVPGRETFRDLYERKEHATANEIIDVVNEYHDHWVGIREALARFAREGREYRYTLGLPLPVVSAVQRSIENGLAATTHRWDNTLLLESFPEEQLVRVVAYGPDGPDTSYIYDILNLDEYRAAIEERLAMAQLEREARCWSYLLH